MRQRYHAMGCGAVNATGQETAQRASATHYCGFQLDDQCMFVIPGPPEEPLRLPR
jgi:hypothetical protein